MSVSSWLFNLLQLLSIIGFVSSCDLPFEDGGPPDFLFLGSSFTEVGDFDEHVASMVRERVSQWRDVTTARNTFLGAGLERQVQANSVSNIMPGEQACGLREKAVGLREKAVALLRGTFRAFTNTRDHGMEWKWVVLQGNSAYPACYDEDPPRFQRSLDAARTLNDQIEEHQGQTMFVMTWTKGFGDKGVNFPEMTSRLREGYKRFVATLTTPERPVYLAPVGLVFETIYDDLQAAGKDPTADGTIFKALYNDDFYHCSPDLGGFTAGLTIFTAMTGFNPFEVPFNPTNTNDCEGIDGVTEEQLDIIRDAVSRTILATFESGEITYPWTIPWTDHTC